MLGAYLKLYLNFECGSANSIDKVNNLVMKKFRLAGRLMIKFQWSLPL